MTVTFRRMERACGWTALRPPRTVVPGSVMAIGRDLPHDLFTFVIELELGIEHGFWGCVADGATFRTIGRKRTPQGKAVIRRHRTELDEAEWRVNEVYVAWREGRPTPLDRQLDAMLARWRALPEGGELTVEWPADRRRSRAGAVPGRTGQAIARSSPH
jgi:hypothetical protein